VTCDVLFLDHPDPVWMVHPGTGVILAANRAACTRYGYSAEEFSGMELDALADPGCAPTDERPGTHRTRQGCRMEVALSRGTGTWHCQPAEIVVARILPPTETLEYARLQAAKARETVLREALTSGSFGLWEYEVEHDRLWLSPETYAIFGVPREEFGNTFADFAARVHPDDLPALMRARERAVRNGATLDTVHRIVRPDGTVRHVRQVAHQVDGPDGAVRRGICQDVSDYIAADTARRTAQELLDLAGEVALFGGWRLDLEEESISWTAGMSAIHGTKPGWTPDSAEAALEFYAPEHRQQARAAFDACARDGRAFDGTWRFRAADGQEKWVRAVGVASRDASGAVVAVQGALQDVSELHAAQQRSRRLSLRLMQTLENISDAFFLLNADFTFAYVNAEAERILRRPRASLEGRCLWEELPEADGLVRQKFEHAVNSHETVILEVYRADRDAWYYIKAYPTGEGLAVHFEDITEDRRRKETLRPLDNAMARLNDIVLITEADPLDAPDGPRIVWVNDAFERRTGYSRDEVVGLTPRILQGPDTQRDELDRIRNAMVRREPVRSEIINYHKDGTPLWLEIEIVPLADPDGKVTHFIAVERDITDRKAAEAALRESEMRFQLVAKAANDVIFDYDVQNDRVWWSDAMLTIFGHAPDAGDGALEFWTTYLHPDDRDAAHASLLEAFEGDADSWVGEYRFRRADGSYADVVDRGLILRDDEGRPLRWVGSMIDVTELRESEERFRLAARAAKDVIFAYDFVTGDHWWSEAIHTHYGHRPKQDGSSLQSWSEMIHPEDRAAVMASHTAAVRAGAETWTKGYRFLRADGSFAHVIDRAYFIRDSEGRPLKSIGSIVDVTQMREDEMRFRAVAQVAADAIYDYDPGRGEVYYSQGIGDVFGHPWTGLQKVPSPWADCVHESERDAVQADFRAFVEGTAQSASFEYRLRRSDGSLAIVEEKAVALRDSEGRATRIIGSLHDISTQREFEERLRQSQKLEAMGQLTGGVAHDFNNLLTIILGNAEILEGAKELPQSLRGMLKSIVTAADRGAGLTNSLLAFARRQPLDPRPVDPYALLADLEVLLAPTLPANIETCILTESGLWLADADPAQLTAALLNLALNACDAMPGGGRLSVECANVVMNHGVGSTVQGGLCGNFLRISVSDTGTGMTSEVRQRAFDPFFTTKPSGQGSGMGLSMVYGFARQSGGQAHIHSEPGRGTTVSLYLPCSSSQATQAPAVPEEAPAATGHGEHILVVEDDRLLRQHVRDTIAGLGYRVSAAANATEALEVLRSQRGIRLLFTDIVMSGPLDGCALAEKAEAEFPGIKVLFTSGYSENAAVRNGNPVSGMALLKKPYRRQELAARLREILEAPEPAQRVRQRSDA
jgi:PAS domain S-box-containing protein